MFRIAPINTRLRGLIGNAVIELLSTYKRFAQRPTTCGLGLLAAFFHSFDHLLCVLPSLLGRGGGSEYGFQFGSTAFHSTPEIEIIRCRSSFTMLGDFFPPLH